MKVADEAKAKVEMVARKVEGSEESGTESAVDNSGRIQVRPDNLRPRVDADSREDKRVDCRVHHRETRRGTAVGSSPLEGDKNETKRPAETKAGFENPGTS